MTSLVLATALQAAMLAAEPQNGKSAPGQDFQAAVQRSVKSGRPLVVLLGADWCPACRVMKKSTLPEVAKAGGLKNVEFAYVDADREPKLVDALARGNSIPQLIRFQKTDKGWKARYLIGAQTAKQVSSFLEAPPPAKPPAAKFSSRRSSIILTGLPVILLIIVAQIACLSAAFLLPKPPPIYCFITLTFLSGRPKAPAIWLLTPNTFCVLCHTVR